ncbi:hypothetical protein RHS04_03047 [Rhizoctonia solani]|uniref:GH18 domain-containing protein n=1 Tax=Rhizoctonia solani TaxID=456999 RepID=A0A8H7HBP6_9AGAM|nr:hypothetical protein RHS04_03047 [Rhizoctonia solani]
MCLWRTTTSIDRYSPAARPREHGSSMHTLAALLFFSLAAAPSFSRPFNPSSSSILPDEDPVPILFLPPSIVKSGSPVEPLFITGPTLANHQGSPPPTPTSSPPQTTLTVVQQAVETIHVVAETKFMTITITVQAPPSRPSPTLALASASASISAPEPESGNSASSNAEMKPFVATYFPDWTGDEFPPEKVDFKRFAWIDFGQPLTIIIFFSEPDNNYSPFSFSPYYSIRGPGREPPTHIHIRQLGRSLEPTGQICPCARQPSQVEHRGMDRYFSDAVSTDVNRRELVKNTVQMYKKFNLDGIDIDWEYPGVQGAGNNQVSPQDSTHFLTFLQLLRSQLPKSAKLTAATQVTPFAGPDGRPLADVSEFAKVLDWILIMNYDIWGGKSAPDASASASVAAWTSAGFPSYQITLGLPSYGYVQTSDARKLIQRSRTAKLGNLRIRRDDGTPGTGSVRVQGEGEGDDSGQVQFKQLVNVGALKLNSNGNYVGAGGFNRLWDVCSSTPYLVSQNAKQVVAYDDPQSLGMKAAFARGAGLRGVNMFDVHGDTENWTLTDAIREGLGLV